MCYSFKLELRQESGAIVVQVAFRTEAIVGGNLSLQSQSMPLVGSLFQPKTPMKSEPWI